MQGCFSGGRDLVPPAQLSVQRCCQYTVAILHVGVQVMSPTATQLLRYMETYFSRYLTRGTSDKYLANDAPRRG